MITDTEARALAQSWQLGQPPPPTLRAWVQDALKVHSILLTGHFLGLSYTHARALAEAALARGSPNTQE